MNDPNNPNVDVHVDETVQPPTCPWCGQLLLAAVGCTAEAIAVAGWPPRTYVYGTEPGLVEIEAESGDGVPPECDDCGAHRLELHHPGCCVAVCRDCDDQAFGCEHCDGGDDDPDPGEAVAA
jgi:hypothetical protein